MNNNYGFVAITTVLVVFAVVTVIGLSVSLISVSNLQGSFTHYQGSQSHYFVEACADYALLELNQAGTVSAIITTPEGSCNAVINSQVGDIWDFTIEGGQNNFQKQINIEASRTGIVTVNSWVEN